MPFSLRKTFNTPDRSYFLRFLAWIAVLNFVDLLSGCFVGKTKAKEKKRVVFARLDGIGDYVLWTVVFEAIESIYPPSEFERILVVNSSSIDVVDDNAPFERTISVDRKRFVTSVVYRFRILRDIRRLGADILINPTVSRDMLWADSLARCSGASAVIGHTGRFNRMPPLAQRTCDGWYTRLVNTPPDGHALLADRALMNALGASSDLAPPKLDLKKGVSGNLPRGNFAVVFLGAGSPGKRWPVEHFAAVARFILDEYKAEIVVPVGPGEEHLREEFSLHFAAPFTRLANGSLAEIGSVLRAARFAVTNDTSVAHIAAAVGCPSAVILSGASERFLPYPEELGKNGTRQICITHPMPCFGCEWNCIYHEIPADQPKPCVADITVESVVAAVRRLVHEIDGAKLEGHQYAGRR